MFLGINNFMLGTISELGLPAAFIFSLGAIIFSFGYRFQESIRNKRRYGVFWVAQNSNLFKIVEQGNDQKRY